MKFTVTIEVEVLMSILPFAVVASSDVVVEPANGRTVKVAVYPVRSQSTPSVCGRNANVNVVACGHTRLYVAVN